MNFTSCVKNLFIQSINHFALKAPQLLVPKKHSVKLSFEDLRIHDFDVRQTLGQICVETGNISFQDMASTLRAFEDFFDVHLKKDGLVNDLIVTQASRHCIVHSSSLVDNKFLNQIRDCTPRTLLKDCILGESLLFTPNDINEIVAKMKEFIKLIVTNLNSKLIAASSSSNKRK
jgi:hypothetical protein